MSKEKEHTVRLFSNWDNLAKEDRRDYHFSQCIKLWQIKGHDLLILKEIRKYNHMQVQTVWRSNINKDNLGNLFSVEMK